MSNNKFPSKVNAESREMSLLSGKFVVSGTAIPTVISNDGPRTSVSASIISTGSITLNLGTTYPDVLTAQIDIWTTSRSNLRLQFVSHSVSTDGKINFVLCSGTSIAAVNFPANTVHTCSYEIVLKNSRERS